MRAEGQITLQDLHRVQEELQQHLAHGQEQAREIEGLGQRLRELTAERDGVQAALAEREQEHRERLAELERELSGVRAEGQITLQDLHRVQEDLQEHLAHGQEQAREIEGFGLRLAEREQEHRQRHVELAQQISQLEQQLSAAREEGQITLQQLFQAKKEHERREQAVIQERDAALVTLSSHEQENRLQKARVEQLEEQLGEVRAEGECTLQQLHLTQEELEHFFLVSRSQAGHLERYEQLLRRGEQLLFSAVTA